MTRVLLVGFDPSAIPDVDADAVAPAFEQGRRRAAELGVELVECLVAPDESADDQIADALHDGDWDCVVNVVHRYAPRSAIAFNTSPAETGMRGASRRPSTLCAQTLTGA